MTRKLKKEEKQKKTEKKKENKLRKKLIKNNNFQCRHCPAFAGKGHSDLHTKTPKTKQNKQTTGLLLGFASSCRALTECC